MALLGAKPHGFGWEMRTEGWMISPSLLRHFPESTRWRRRVDSYTYNQSTRRSIRVESYTLNHSTRRNDWVDSATHLSRLEIIRITTRGEIKKAPIHQNRRPNNHEKIVEEKNFNPLNRHRNCCHHHPHQSFRCHHYRQYHREHQQNLYDPLLRRTYVRNLLFWRHLSIPYRLCLPFR